MPLTDSDCAATYKILVLGDTTVGKSSILRTLTGKDFVNKTLPTVGKYFILINVKKIYNILIVRHVYICSKKQRHTCIRSISYFENVN